MPASVYSRNFILNTLFKNTAGTLPSAWYVALFTADPEESTSNEVTAADYARISTTFVTPLAGATRNAADVTFGTATTDWGTVTHFAIFDALTSGNMLHYDALETSLAIVTDDQVVIKAGELEVEVE